MTDENPEGENANSSGGETDPKKQTQNDEQQSGKVDAKNSGNSGSGNGDGVPKGLKTELFKLREKNREFRAQNELLQKQLAEVNSGSNRRTQTEDADDGGASESIFDNPDKVLDKREKKILSQVEKLIADSLTKRQDQSDFDAGVESAEKWLLSQKDLEDDPEALDEIKDILRGNKRINKVFKADPEYGVEKAFQEWKKQKGLGNGENEASRARNSGVGPSGTRNNGQKVWTLAEIKVYLDPSLPEVELEKRHKEVLKAQVEGRIK